MVEKTLYVFIHIVDINILLRFSSYKVCFFIYRNIITKIEVKSMQICRIIAE